MTNSPRETSFSKLRRHSSQLLNMDDTVFAANTIRTGRYSLLSFIPKALFGQFRRLANMYFLFISMLMLIGSYTSLFDSPLLPWSTLGPLVIVLILTMTKEGLEDIKRHISDRQINNSPCHVMDESGTFIETQWRDVKVGDILKVSNNEDIPADIVLLYTPEEDSLAYIETANIDGETNLKIRNPARTGDTTVAFDSEADIYQQEGEIEFERPNTFIHTFTGTLEMMEKKTALDQSNLLLRGSVLRNTRYAVGACIYTGSETKIVMNSHESRTKMASVDDTINSTIYLIMGFQVALSFLTLVGYVIFDARKGDELWYICEQDAEKNIPEGMDTFKTGCAFEAKSASWGFFFTYFILYNNFIPISLYVTVEMCNYAHAHYIDNDLKMYDAEQDVPAAARTSNLGSDLGMVEYIFSDKTGTLTQNIMRFQKCSVGGVSYVVDRTEESLLASGDTVNPTNSHDDEEAQRFSNASNKGRSSSVAVQHEPIRDLKSLANVETNVKKRCDDAFDFVATLGLCHTIVVETDETTGERTYKAESPDEEALVDAAKSLGFELFSRSTSAIVVKTSSNQTISYKIHATIPFDSARKRMSVVIEAPDGSYVLYSKGADNIMLGLAKKSEQDFSTLNQHLNEYAKDGLRTLVLAKKELSKAQFKKFTQAWDAACATTENRYEEMAKAAATIENGLTVVGATAIEDALQDDVPNTINELMKAGIKLWVLTGDKMETAINIGYSCKLLQEQMTLIKLQNKNDDPDSVKNQLRGLVNHFGKVTRDPKNFFLRFGRNMGKGVKKVRHVVRGVAKSIYNAPIFRPQNSLDSEATGTAGESVDTENVDVAVDDFEIDDGSSDEEETDLPEGVDIQQLQSEYLAIIMDGPSLTNVLGDKEAEKLLLKIATMCKAVIACRVSPSQKALIVKLVKNRVQPTPLTLAIGDGANDVGMIQEAQVGVGISGREGRQAVNSSDFAIAQFKFLKRLLLVHGRWNYRRLSKCVCYSFYKNTVLVMVLFFYGFFTAYSGQSLFEDMVYSGFNFFLGMPPLMIGMFDKDVSEKTLMTFHKMYMSGRERIDLNAPVLASWLTQGLFDGGLIYFMTWVMARDLGGLYVFGTTAYSALILSMCFKAASNTYTWNAVVAFFWIGSIILFGGIFLPIYSSWPSYSPAFYGVFVQMAENAPLYLVLLLVPTTILLLDLAKKLFRSIYLPNPIDHGIELDRGITYDSKQMLLAYSGDAEARQRYLMETKGATADDGMFKWWNAVNNKLPRFKFDRNKLRSLNRNISEKEKKDLGIVDTEEENTIHSFAFDYVSRNVGIGASNEAESSRNLSRISEDTA